MENEEIQEDFKIIDLKQIVLFLLKKAWIIVIAVIVFALSGFVYSKYYTVPVYTSRATLFVMNVRPSGGFSTGELSGYASLANDYTKIMKRTAVLENVVEKNALSISPDELGAKINISADVDSRIMRVAVSDTDPAVAKELCDMFCTETKINIEELMNEDQITIIDYGSLPKQQSSPQVGKNVILCMFFGFILSAGILTAVFIFKDTVNTADDAEQRVGLKVIGQIPYSSKLDEGKKI